MCIKSAPYLHKKMLIGSKEVAVPAYIFYYDVKYAPTIMIICPK